jgi:hypothetical protein
LVGIGTSFTVVVLHRGVNVTAKFTGVILPAGVILPLAPKITAKVILHTDVRFLIALHGVFAKAFHHAKD